MDHRNQKKYFDKNLRYFTLRTPCRVSYPLFTPTWTPQALPKTPHVGCQMKDMEKGYSKMQSATL
jgi:hypothetical protein